MRCLLTLLAALVLAGPASAITPMQKVDSAGVNLGPKAAAPASVMYVGHSMIANGTGLTRTAGASMTLNTGAGYTAWWPNAMNNAALTSPSGFYGVGSSTTCNLAVRLTDLGTVAANTAATGNPAGRALSAGTPPGCGVDNGLMGTALAADGNYNSGSQGLFAPLTDPANCAVYLHGINDTASTWYTTAPTAKPSAVSPYDTMAVIAYTVDQLHKAGKCVLYVDQTPHGLTAVMEELHVVGAGVNQTFTLTNSSNSIVRDAYPQISGSIPTSGGVIDNLGVIYTYDGTACSGGGITGHYAFAANTVTMCGANTGITVFVDYAYGSHNVANSAVTLFERTVHLWGQSAAKNFVDPERGINYGIPGLLYRRQNWLFPVNCYEKLVNPTTATGVPSTGTYEGYPGIWDTVGIHPYMTAQHLCADAMAATFTATWPGAVSVAPAPTTNNWTPCTSNGSSATLSSGATACGGITAGPWTGQMISHCNSAVGGITLLDNSIPFAVSDGAGNFITATAANSARLVAGSQPGGGTLTNPDTVTAGTYNCGTGAWTVTTSAIIGNTHVIEIAMDPSRYSDHLDNGLMDATQTGKGANASLPTGFTPAAGLTALTALPRGWQFAAPGTCLAASLASGHVTVTVSNNVATTPITFTDKDASGPWPGLQLTFTGMLDGAGCTNNLDETLILFNQTIPVPGNWYGLEAKFAAYGTVIIGAPTTGNYAGHLIGFEGVETYGNAQSASAYTLCWGTSGTQSFIFGTGAMAPALGIAYSDLDLYGGTSFIHDDLTPTFNLCKFAGQTAISPNTEVMRFYIAYRMGKPVSFTITLGRAGQFLRP